MTFEATDQEKRSREIADKIRTYLTALNTGGIAMTFAVAGSLASQKVNPAWAVWPVVCFVVGLVILGASLFLAKHKALKRRHNPSFSFSKWYWRNFTYDLLALAMFCLAVGIGLWRLSCLRLPV
jgi:hypothetical protein